MLPHSFNGWMNVAGASGVLLFLGSYFLVLKGFVESDSRWIRHGRLCGAALLVTPLFLRWQLSSSLLITLGLLIATLGAWYVYRNREL